MKRALAAVAVLAVAGCGSYTIPAPPSPPPASPAGSEGEPSAGLCGVERWAVKTGTDPDVGHVVLHPAVNTTVANLTALTPPADLPSRSRVAPVEDTTYRVRATLTAYKQEPDSDYHLVLASAGQTMVAEIPAPDCVAGASPLLPGIKRARAEFDAHLDATTRWHRVHLPVTVTGVGFFDDIHGQTGVARNGIELHPVLGIRWAGQ